MKDIRDETAVTASADCSCCEWRITGTGDRDPGGLVVRAAQQHTAHTAHVTITHAEVTTWHVHTGVAA